jgi:hypothetical protein
MTTLLDLEHQLAALPPDPVVQRRLDEERESEQRRVLEQRVAVARECERTLAVLEPQVAGLTKKRDDCQRWLAALTTERDALATKQPLGHLEHARLNNLAISIAHVTTGFDRTTEMYPINLVLDTYMLADGYTAPPDQAWNVWAAIGRTLPELEAALKLLTTRRDDAQRRLEDALA